MTASPLLLLLPAALGLPLLLAALSALPGLRRRSLTLSTIAPLPGLAAALFAPRDELLFIPDVLLSVSLRLTEAGAVFLGGASLLWLAAGLFSRAYMRGHDRAGSFALFWNLVLAGNLGVFIAADAVSFYVCFALVSLAAWPLVVHERTARARRAGTVYIALAVAGETALLAGLVLAVDAAHGSLDIGAVRAGVIEAPDQWVVLALLIFGFGLKAGLIPLHVWLPVAHPAAPTPASAVLSGAIVKAGIFGLLVFLPLEAGLAAPGAILAMLGLAGAFAAALVGLTQSDPKTVLAYSTVSQMGLVMGAMGLAFAAGAPAGAVTAAMALYALHHGLAKGALFLGVGAMQKTGGRAAWRLRAVLVLVAVSIAGLPMTGGALAKLALKQDVASWAALLIAASAFTTALVLLRFFAVLGRAEAAEARASRELSVPVLALALGAVALPWALLGGTGLAPGYALQPANWIQALVPLALAGLAWRAWRGMKGPAISEGDVLVPAIGALDALVRLAGRSGEAGMRLTAPLRRWHLPRTRGRMGDWLARAEAALADNLAAALMVAVLVFAAATLL